VLTAGKGTGLLLGVRPEDVTITEGPGVSGRVAAVEYLGADSIVICSLGTQALAVRVPGRVELEPGARVTLAWPAAAAHLFDATAGTRCTG
jgi:sn-glycerol 3-phosphate transport system ATP-binding protein